MADFGEKLQRARKRRKLTVEQVAETTKIGLRYLRALEQNEFENLPGGVFNRGYVRAYAKAVDADPEELVQAYVAEEQARGLGDSTEDTDLLKASLEASVAGRDVAVRAPGGGHRIRNVALAGLLSVGLLVLAVWFKLAPRQAEGQADRGPAVASVTAPDPAAETTEDRTPREPLPSLDSIPAGPSGPASNSLGRPDDPQPPAVVASMAERAAPAVVESTPPPEPTTDSPPRLSVMASGVGSGVVNHELQGRTDRFEEGAEAWFWTRVVGGRRGDKIRHVWYLEGERIGVSVLKLGGSHWRTHSRRTLRRGGLWTVEVRDEKDRVLASEQFVCEAADAFRPRRQTLAW